MISTDLLTDALSAHLSQFPALSKLLDQLGKQEVPLEVRPCQQGVEFRFQNESNGIPNRGYLRIFFPLETKCVLFFHKKSSVPYSRDRFSYGGVVIDARSAGRFSDEDVVEWIEFLWSGLQPKSRPASLKKSFPYTVPED